MNPGWMWSFRAEPPLLAIAVVLSHLSAVSDTHYGSKAWTQVNIVFDRYINVDGSYKPPILASLQKFRDLVESLQTQTSLDTVPAYKGYGDALHWQNLFDYLVSGEEPNVGSLSAGYQDNDLFPLGPLSTDAVT
jgi:hypothetical protein